MLNGDQFHSVQAIKAARWMKIIMSTALQYISFLHRSQTWSNVVWMETNIVLSFLNNRDQILTESVVEMYWE